MIMASFQLFISLISGIRPAIEKRIILPILIGFFCFLIISPASGQFLRRSGKDIVDENGKPFLLRGMGLGGWMLQEGYMLETNSFANAQHEIRNRIEELIGAANTDDFYDAWITNHCTKRDIDSLKSWGFNSVRLPMHYNLFTLPIEQEPVPGENTWLERGFVMTDSLLKWCAANSIYVILDLHAAPGGQGRDAAISDYDASKPSLWESEENRKKTVALWRRLAERYANEKWIGGYDLINETNWNFTPGANGNGCDEATNAPLRALLVEITNAIREVDTNHLIFIEGNCWANNHRGLFPAWDNNMAISFHKYWSYNDIGSIQGMINLRNQYSLPLWMGEAGENSNVWFSSAIDLLEKNNIGWAWWPMKKVGSVVGPLTIKKNPGYNTLLNYWKNGGTKPSVEFAKEALMQLTTDLRIENNIFQKDVIDAMFRQVTDHSAQPYRDHIIPGTIHLSDYDLGRHNVAYSDRDTATNHVSAGTYTAWNNGWVYRNDGVDIEASSDSDPKSNGYNVGWTADGEWLQYTVTVDSSASYKVILRYAAAGSASVIQLSADLTEKTPMIALPSTGGNQVWKDHVIENVIMYKGLNRIRLHFVKGGANVSTMHFSLQNKIADVTFQALSGTTSMDGTSVYLYLNKRIHEEASPSKEEFSFGVNDETKPVSAAALVPGNPFILEVRTPTAFIDSDNIKLSYAGESVVAADETTLASFTDLAITNSLPVHILIPAKIEAENFVTNVGLQLETTTDTGGGQNIAYTNAGDYLDYRVRVATAGEYQLEVRVASAGAPGIIEFQQLNTEGGVINSTRINVPVTGGWQLWQTVNGKMKLDAVRGILRVKIIQPEFNLNWFRFSPIIINSTEKERHGSLHFSPNPADTHLRIHVADGEAVYASSVCIRSMNGQILRRFKDIQSHDHQPVYVGDLSAGLYLVEIISTHRTFTGRFMKR